MTFRPSTAAPSLAVLAVVLVTLGAYLGGYFWLGDRLYGGPAPLRYYRYRWQATLFTPAAKVDSYLRGYSVSVTSQEEIDILIYSPASNQAP